MNSDHKMRTNLRSITKKVRVKLHKIEDIALF